MKKIAGLDLFRFILTIFIILHHGEIMLFR